MSQEIEVNDQIVAQLVKAWSELADQQCNWFAEAQTIGQCLQLAENDDQICAQLVRLSQEGIYEAGIVIVMALLEKLQSLAWRRGRRFSVSEAIGTLWERIMTFPKPRLKQKILINLWLDVIKLLTRQFHCPQPSPIAAAASPTNVADVDGQMVIEAGVNLKLLNPGTAQVMKSFYIDAMTGREIAEKFNLSETTVRYRCSSGKKQLQNHRRQLLTAA